MGLKKESVLLLMKEGLREPFNGRMITLGRQDVLVTYEEVIELAKQVNYPLRLLSNVELSDKFDMKKLKCISDRSLFFMLGFDDLKSVDFSSYENADVIYDLNQDLLPADLVSSANVVLDPGTIEHVFHVPNSLKNIFNMLKMEGRVIHIAPSSNHMDHGFYMFSPTLFRDYYFANQFDLQPLKIIRYRPQSCLSWKIASYFPPFFQSFSFGGLDACMYAVYCIAKKTALSSSDRIPQQSHYEDNLWKETSKASRISRLKNLIKKSPFFYRGSLVFYRFYKQFVFLKKFTSIHKG